MIIFRPHRRLLDESMAEAKEFNTIEEMKEHIVKLWHEGWDGPKELFTVDDIVINKESAANDERIGWEDSMYVSIKRLGDEDYMKKYGTPQCIGMCATKYKKACNDMRITGKFSRNTIKTMIEISPTVEDADKIISVNYSFKSIGEKIAFLKGMFDVEIVCKDDSDEVSEDDSIEMDYWAMLDTIIHNY